MSTSGQPVLRTECLRRRPFPPKIRGWTWAAVKLMCSDCSTTLQWLQLNPPPKIRSCSEVDVQWLQLNPPPPPPEWGVAVKLMCSDCSWTPPHWNEELQWSWCAVTAAQLCSNCSQTPHQNEELQWSWCAVTAVQLCSDCSWTPPPHQNEEL